ncbi:hypothetical protein B0T24DRAFT_677751 [Lasiosphaeria ovina]|uniref:Uncharacterized protein n=1 Tax=Lasiosphaeria ovina TaxID=92902 RepID=A0AAE0KII0_9PEZI|nr:hypothetical protein B0T24DRAFT_677751 [Lasiosphaeria ovina]
MCRTREIHFSAHDVRGRMATELFSADEVGDFTDPTRSLSCRCGISAVFLIWQTRRSLTDITGCDNGFKWCARHTCCVRFACVTHCFDVLAQITSSGLDMWEQDAEELARDCPIGLTTHAYQPLSMVTNTIDLDFPEVDDWDIAEPTFPADIFYARKLPAGNGADDADSNLRGDRADFFTFSYYLAEAKAKLEYTIELADDTISRLESDVSEGKFGSINTAEGLGQLNDAAAQLSLVEFHERDAAILFGHLVECERVILRRLGRLPVAGRPTTASEDTDGSFYSISKERLDLAGLDSKDIIAKCEGPLKQSGNLRQRIDRLRELMKGAERAPRVPLNRPLNSTEDDDSRKKRAEHET